MKTTNSQNFDLEWRSALSDYVTAINWSADGKILAVSSAIGEVKLRLGNELINLQSDTGKSVDGLAFSGDGKFLAAGGQDGEVRVWDTHTQQTIITLENAPNWVDKLAWCPQKNLLAFSLGKYVQIWDADAKELVVTLNFDNSSVLSLDWSHDGNYLAIAGYQGVKIWQFPHWDEDPYFFSVPSASLAVTWSRNGKYIASGNMDKTICVLETGCIADGRQAEPWLMHGFPGKIRHLAWSNTTTSPNEPLLASSSVEGVVVWEHQDDKSLGWDATVLNGHSETVEAIAFAPHSLMLASAAADGCVCLWKQAKHLSQILQGASAGFSCLAWHPEGDKLAAGGHHGELLVWKQSLRGKGFG
jgi:WD40 repeat protein